MQPVNFGQLTGIFAPPAKTLFTGKVQTKYKDHKETHEDRG